MTTDCDLIAEGRKKLAVATDAPWKVDVHSHLEKDCRCLCCHDNPTVTLTTNMLDCQDVPVPDGADQTRCEQSGYTWDDAQLIVWMRNNVPTLLDELTELRDLRDRMITLADQADKSTPDEWGVHYVYTFRLRAALEGKADDQP